VQAPAIVATVLASSYVAVLAAEIVGDKTLYTLGSLSTRHRIAPLAAGALLAFGVKMLVAVLAGRALAELPQLVVRLVGCATFVAMAIALWRKPVRKPVVADAPDVEPPHWWRPAAAAFAAIFLSEWGDPGQLTAAALSARSGEPALVWTAATLAMATKGALGLTLGQGLRKWVSHRAARLIAATSCLAMAALSLLE
jgi:putative Ca2+/H+ antiporter (TMEM165/GDT1 family)